LKVLYIARAYPPIIGGIERQNFELGQALGELVTVRIIANRHGKKLLPLFYPLALLRALLRAPAHDVVLLGDGVLAPMGVVIRWLTRTPVCCVIHGLDVTYPNRFYQRFWVRRALPRMDRLFAVGNETIRAAVKRGVPESICRFIPNGTLLPADTTIGGAVDPARGDTFWLLTLGRLAERKGVAWFIAEVLPLLPANIHYQVAGEGPARPLIEQAVAGLAEPARVSLLGEVSAQQRVELMLRADLFVQPNIPIPGDMEGFGLVVLEAAAAGLPVVASRLEGLQDAVTDGENGLLVEPGDSGAYAETIRLLVENPRERAELAGRGRRFVEQNCLWSHVAGLYLAELQELLKERGEA
jgi:phosphatidylinositol alpha-1,6-mannosyltransferase